jgi:DNA-directed RNA polymerase alpha subunit
MKAGIPLIESMLPNALPRDVIATALTQLEVAMLHGNKDEAFCVVQRAFEVAGQEPITARSPIARLDLVPRLVSILEARKITQVGHLLEMTLEDVLRVNHVGPKGATQIRIALRRAGMKLRVPMRHGVPKWAVDLKAG